MHSARMVLFHRLNNETYEEAKACKECARLSAIHKVDEIILEDFGPLPLTQKEEDAKMKAKKKPVAKAKPAKKKK